MLLADYIKKDWQHICRTVLACTYTLIHKNVYNWALYNIPRLVCTLKRRGWCHGGGRARLTWTSPESRCPDSGKKNSYLLATCNISQMISFSWKPNLPVFVNALFHFASTSQKEKLYIKLKKLIWIKMKFTTQTFSFFRNQNPYPQETYPPAHC